MVEQESVVLDSCCDCGPAEICTPKRIFESRNTTVIVQSCRHGVTRASVEEQENVVNSRDDMRPPSREAGDLLEVYVVAGWSCQFRSRCASRLAVIEQENVIDSGHNICVTGG